MTDFQDKAHRHFNNKTEDKMSEKTTITGADVEKMRANLENITKIRNVESLLSLHNDEQTTREINADWKELRETVDGRASREERKVKGSITIKIDYEADSDTGKKEITVSRKLDLPPPPKNTRTLYEDKDGHLSTVKPTKQMDMFPGESRPARGV